MDAIVRQPRKAFTIKQKLKMIHEADLRPNWPKHKLAKYFGVAQSTLSSIMNQREKVEMSFHVADSSTQRVRKGKYAALEKRVLEWYLIARAANNKDVQSGVVIRQKAEAIAAQMGIEFSASNGWISRFKSRHANICGNSRTKTKASTLKPSTPSTSSYLPTTYVPKVVEASATSSSISKEQSSVSVSMHRNALVNQQDAPGLPQITQISWGTAVPSLPTGDTSWTILPTASEVVQKPAAVSRPQTRDIGVQVEVISLQTKNVIVSREWETSSQPELRTPSGDSQCDVVSDFVPSCFPLPSRELQSQDRNKEFKKRQVSSGKNGKTERVFLVFETVLLQLFTFCRLCCSSCSATVSSSCISVVMVQTTCNNGHKLNWESKPPRKQLGLIELLQKEVNRLRKELSESQPFQQQRANARKRLKQVPEFIDVVELLDLPKPMTRSHAKDNRYINS